MSLEPRLYKPFVDGTVNTLKIQCNLSATPEQPFIKKNQALPSSIEIAAIISMTSDAFCGTIALLFPEKVYLKLMTGMLGEEFKELTQDLQDGAAELLNIIFGFAKAVLSQEGYTVQKAIPTVVRGFHLKTAHLGNSASLILPFNTETGPFYIEICGEHVRS